MKLRAMLVSVLPRANTIFLLGLIALVPLVVFAGYALATAFDTHRRVDEERLRNTARALTTAVDAQFDALVMALETLASSLLLDDPGATGIFEDRAQAVARRLEGGIFLLGPAPEYLVLASTGLRPAGSMPESLRATLGPTIEAVLGSGTPAISDLFQGAADPRLSLAVMVPVDRDGQPRRVLGLRLEPTALRNLLMQQQLPPGTFAAIADSRFRILAHSMDPEGRGLGAVAPDWVAPAIAGHRRILVTGPGWSGEDNVYAVEHLSRPPGWTVTVAEPLALQQFSAWKVIRWILAGVCALGIAVAIVVWAARREAILDAWRETDALRTGRAQVERLLGGLPALIFLRLIRPDGSSHPTFRAGAIRRVTGWPAAEILKLNSLDDLTHPDDASFGREVNRILREGQAAYEYRIRQPHGGWRTLQTAARVLERHVDGSTDVVGYTVDVTALREAEARAQAATRLAALGELAAGLAHELRQPLSTIAMAAENALAALDAHQADDARRRLERIKVQTTRAASLIERLRRFSRGGGNGTSVEDVALDAVIAAGLEMTRAALQEARVEVEVELDRPAPVVRGQVLLLEQVLSNLLINARDALAERPPGAERRINIEGRSQPGGTVRLTIADTGGGIPPDVMDRLFEPFVTTKRPDKGTGLGLSICNALVKEMDGTIKIHNAAAGAVVDIILPAAH